MADRFAVSSRDPQQCEFPYAVWDTERNEIVWEGKYLDLAVWLRDSMNAHEAVVS